MWFTVISEYMIILYICSVLDGARAASMDTPLMCKNPGCQSTGVEAVKVGTFYNSSVMKNII